MGLQGLVNCVMKRFVGGNSESFLLGNTGVELYGKTGAEVGDNYVQLKTTGKQLVIAEIASNWKTRKIPILDL